MRWPYVAFESLYQEPSRNGIYKSKEFHGSGCKIVNMGELFGLEFIGDQSMKRLELSDGELKKNLLLDGDLLFGRRSLVESGAGKCSVVINPTEDTTFESSIIRVRLDKKKSNPLFYYYWFKSPVGRAKIKAIVTGTNVKGIKGSDLKNLSVAAPDLDTQNKVVSICRKYDDLIENNRRRIQLLEESARLLYQEWFVHLRFPGHEHVSIADGVPKGWDRKKLIEVAELTMGQSPKSEFYNEIGEGLPFHQGVTNYGSRFVEHKTYCTHVTRIAEAGDILCSVRAPVGRLNITNDKIVVGRGLAALRSKRGKQSFLFYALRSFFFKENIIGSGAIYAAVTKKEMELIELLVPDDKLLDEFESTISSIDHQIATLTTQSKRLESARDLLLPKFMSGEFTV